MLAEAQTIMAYYSLPDEVNTHALIDELVAEGKTVLLPKVTGDDTMELRRYTGRADLQEGSYHILEPVGERFTDYAAIDLAVIPGVAFTPDGKRLGRGKGYYDRFLTLIPDVYKIGMCFPWQLVDHVPCDEHDIGMDAVVF